MGVASIVAGLVLLGLAQALKRPRIRRAARKIT
jgi:hypothetical protein